MQEYLDDVRKIFPEAYIREKNICIERDSLRPLEVGKKDYIFIWINKLAICRSFEFNEILGVLKAIKDCSTKLIICGKEVDPKVMPRFYNFAKNSPKCAEAQIRGMVEVEHKLGNKKFTYGAAMAILDSDLP